MVPASNVEFEATLDCQSPEETFRAGKTLAGLLAEGDAIGLQGDLGAGKTLFVQGLAEGLEVPEEVRITSPTFALVNEYRGGRLSMVHIDLYRIEDEKELVHLGLEELIDNSGVCAVEWYERFPVLPRDHLQVEISIDGPEARTLRWKGTGKRSLDLADKLRQALAARS